MDPAVLLEHFPEVVFVHGSRNLADEHFDVVRIRLLLFRTASVLVLYRTRKVVVARTVAYVVVVRAVVVVVVVVHSQRAGSKKLLIN